MWTLLLLFAGGVLLLVGALGDAGAGRTRRRRMEAVKGRHVGTGTVETQLRRISAQRDSRLDTSLTRLLPNPDLLRRRLDATGRDLTLGRYAGGCGIAAAVVFALALLCHAPLLLAALLGVLGGLALPHLVVGRMVKRRLAKFLVRFPDAIELLVRGLRSGLPISETMAVVGAEVPDPVGTEFRQVADKMRIGRAMEGALQDTADRLATPEFQFFVITLAIQRETGGNLAETLGNLADVLRKRLQMKLKVKAMSSEAKASAWIIGILPVLVFGAIEFMNPEYGGAFFTNTKLMIVAGGASVWMAIGVFMMAKMINFEI